MNLPDCMISPLSFCILFLKQLPEAYFERLGKVGHEREKGIFAGSFTLSDEMAFQGPVNGQAKEQGERVLEA